MAFFLGRNAEAIRAIDGLTESLTKDARPVAERAIVSLKAIPEPAVWHLDSHEQRKLRIQSLYKWDSFEVGDIAIEVRLHTGDGIIRATVPLTVRLGPTAVVDAMVVVPDLTRLSVGIFQIELGLPGKSGNLAGHVNVVESSLDSRREANNRKLAAIAEELPVHKNSLSSCRARNQLLTDFPSAANSAQFMTDMHLLAGEVADEIRDLAAGKNPYAGKLGDTWRVFAHGKREIPLRVYAPKSSTGETPLPLLIVLHGMGGDENMFFEAYGAGVIKQLAEEKGILVASPLTYTFGSDFRTLQALLDELATDYRIDRGRIYVLGHSMGAGAAASLARGHADNIAAVCCIAGGTLAPIANTPPVLVVIPELDGVVPPERVLSAAQRAKSQGLPVELREMSGFGHTLSVGIVLPDAVEWLLQHTCAK
jgi:predicted esterase